MKYFIIKYSNSKQKVNNYLSINQVLVYRGSLRLIFPTNFVEGSPNYDWSIRACLVDQGRREERM